MTILTKKPEAFSAGVAIVPVADWLEMYELSDSAFRRFMQELFEGTPAEKESLYRERSPITHVFRIKAPVIIIHSRRDSRCPIEPVEKFVKKLKEINHPHDFEVQGAEGHGFARVKANIREVTTAMDYLKKVLAWLIHYCSHCVLLIFQIHLRSRCFIIRNYVESFSFNLR